MSALQAWVNLVDLALERSGASTLHLGVISNVDIAIRLLAAAMLGSFVGFERERLLWSAGIRTHMLVAVGAALIMIVSAYGFENARQMTHVVLDP